MKGCALVDKGSKRVSRFLHSGLAIHSAVVKIFEIGARVSLVLLVVLVVGNIIGIRLFGYGVPGTLDFAGLFTLIAISLALAHTQVQRGHVALDFIVKRFSEDGQVIINTVTSVISVILFLVLSWRSIVYGMAALSSGDEAGATGLPLGPFAFIISVGAFLLALTIAVDVANNLSRLRRR